MSDLKSRLTITGEKEYTAAIQEANRTLRVLRSELKAETAELGANATAQDKASAKIKSLKQQIAQQEKIVKNLNEALEKAKTEYADNQEVQDKWEEKLNKARAALAEMKNELESAGKSVEGFDRGLKDSSQNVEKTAASVYNLKSGLDAVGKIADGIGSAIGGAFEALKDTVQTAVNEIMGLMQNAWALAGDWKTIADTYGGSAESVERAYRIVTGAGMEFGTFTGGVNKLIANTHAGSKDFEDAIDTLETLTGLRLDEENFDNHWDYAMSVVEALNSVGDENVRYNLMEKLFGAKRGEGMAEILTKWEGLSLAYQAAANAGMTLNNAEIEATDAAGDAWGWLKTNWDMLETLAGMKLTIGLNMQGFSENVTTVIQDLADLFRNGASAEGMKKLGIDIGVVIDDFGTMMDKLAGWLQETGAGLEENGSTNWSKAIGKGLQALGRLLDWLGDHIDDIIAMLEKLFPVWLVNTGVKAVTGETPIGWVEKFFQGAIDIAVLRKVLFGGKAVDVSQGAQEAQAAANAAATGMNTGSVISGAGSTLADDLATISPESYQGITLWSMAKNELNLAYLRYIKPMTDWIRDNGKDALGFLGAGAASTWAAVKAGAGALLDNVLLGLGPVSGAAGWGGVMAMYADAFLGAPGRWAEEAGRWGEFNESLYGFNYDAPLNAPDAWWQLWGMLDDYDRIWGAGAKTGYEDPHVAQMWAGGIYGPYAEEYGFKEYGGLTAEDMALLAYLHPDLAQRVATEGMSGSDDLKTTVIPVLMEALSHPEIFSGFTDAWAAEWIAMNQELLTRMNHGTEPGDRGASIPAGWYESMEVLMGTRKPGQSGQNGEDSLPAAVATAVAGALKGAKVVMDGATVGSIVMEYVNEGIAGQIIVSG